MRVSRSITRMVRLLPPELPDACNCPVKLLERLQPVSTVLVALMLNVTFSEGSAR